MATLFFKIFIFFFKTERSNPALQGAHGKLSSKEITMIFTDLSPKKSQPALSKGLFINSLMSSSRVLGLNQINPTLQNFQGFISKFSQMQGGRKRGISLRRIWDPWGAPLLHQGCSDPLEIPGEPGWRKWDQDEAAGQALPSGALLLISHGIVPLGQIQPIALGPDLGAPAGSWGWEWENKAPNKAW